jgi:hypothetical protein
MEMNIPIVDLEDIRIALTGEKTWLLSGSVALDTLLQLASLGSDEELKINIPLLDGYILPVRFQSQAEVNQFFNSLWDALCADLEGFRGALPSSVSFTWHGIKMTVDQAASSLTRFDDVLSMNSDLEALVVPLETDPGVGLSTPPAGVKRLRAELGLMVDCLMEGIAGSKECDFSTDLDVQSSIDDLRAFTDGVIANLDLPPTDVSEILNRITRLGEAASRALQDSEPLPRAFTWLQYECGKPLVLAWIVTNGQVEIYLSTHILLLQYDAGAAQFVDSLARGMLDHELGG